MRMKVTDQGVLVPKSFLEGIEEVEIHKAQDVIILVPVSPTDPIFALGKQPIIVDVDDASINHDRYLYDR